MGLLSKSPPRDKEKEAFEQRAASNEHAAPPPPPSYSANAPLDPNDIDAPPDLTAGFANLNVSSISSKNAGHNAPQPPQPGTTIAHLKVLECFYRLRQKIGSSDGLFGLQNDALQTVTSMDEKGDAKLLAMIAEKRWQVYLTRAVDRFERWRDEIAPATQYIRVEDLHRDGRIGEQVGSGSSPEPATFTKDNMPPVGTYSSQSRFLFHMLINSSQTF